MQRRALSEEIAASEKFLREHSAGIADIPPHVIQEAITRNKRARADLAPRPC